MLGSQSTMNIASLNLTHLLDRLENNLKSPANTKPLLRSQYHRARVGVNIEYARTLLLELEQSALATQTSTKSHYPKNALQTDLAQKRQKLKELKGLLEDIESRAAVEEEIRGLEADSDGEEIVPTPLESEGSRTPAELAEKEEEGAKAATQEKPLHEESKDEAPPAEEAQARLRSRRTIATSSETIAATSTGISRTATGMPISTTTTRTDSAKMPQRIRSRTRTTSPTSREGENQTAGDGALQASEADLSRDRAEQETITDSMLKLATQLKESTHTFHSNLEGEKSILARAVEGLDRNLVGMEAAGKRMGRLRRMAEGKGWWGRTLMYAWIFALWVVALLLVFVVPKLRF